MADAPDDDEVSDDVDVDDDPNVREFAMPDTGVDPDPLKFKLSGTTLVSKAEAAKGAEPERWVETFTVLEVLPPGALRDLALSARVDDGNIVWDRYAVLRFMRAVIVPDDEARWDALMHDKRRPCKIDLIGDVMFYVTETKAALPTGPQPGSRAGTAGMRGGSRNGSGSRVGKPRAKGAKKGR